MKNTLALALSILSFAAHSAGIELSEEGKNQQVIMYYCAVSDRFVTLAADAAATGGEASKKIAEDAAEPLMLSKDQIQNYLSYMDKNLDVAQQVSLGYNSGQSCYLAPQKWIINYSALVGAGKIKR
ncbi:hypothetical protein SRABI106_00437 [Rahnella aquatilis]|nr:hypothetical protein SRABI106_00437 [Rahnella aquatilis]